MKRTPQRLAVIEYLKNNQQHPSIMDIHLAISERFPTISLATIYNIMETLRKEGVVRALFIDPLKKRFDTNMAPHHHLLCTSCGEIIDIKGKVELSLAKGEQETFMITKQQAEFYGICLSCSVNMRIDKMEPQDERLRQN